MQWNKPNQAATASSARAKWTEYFDSLSILVVNDRNIR